MGYSKDTSLIQCPAFANKIVDRVGAGDSVLSMTALGLVTKIPLDLSLLLGNFAGAQSVATMCNAQGTNRQLLLKSLKAILG